MPHIPLVLRSLLILLLYLTTSLVSGTSRIAPRPISRHFKPSWDASGKRRMIYQNNAWDKDPLIKDYFPFARNWIHKRSFPWFPSRVMKFRAMEYQPDGLSNAPFHQIRNWIRKRPNVSKDAYSPQSSINKRGFGSRYNMHFSLRNAFHPILNFDRDVLASDRFHRSRNWIHKRSIGMLGNLDGSSDNPFQQRITPNWLQGNRFGIFRNRGDSPSMNSLRMGNWIEKRNDLPIETFKSSAEAASVNKRGILHGHPLLWDKRGLLHGGPLLSASQHTTSKQWLQKRGSDSDPDAT